MWRLARSLTSPQAVRGRACDCACVQPSFYIHQNQYNHHPLTENTRRITCLIPCILTSELGEGQWSTSGSDRLTPQGRSPDTNYIEDFLCPRACAGAPITRHHCNSFSRIWNDSLLKTDRLTETSRLWIRYIKFLKLTMKKTLLRPRRVCISRIDVTLFTHSTWFNINTTVNVRIM